jgi:hypothetical protein
LEIFPNVFAVRGRITKISAQFRRSICNTGSPIFFHLAYSSESKKHSKSSLIQSKT